MKILKNNINKTILGVVLAIFIIGTGLYTLAAIKEPSKVKTEKTVKMKRTITANFLVNKGTDQFEQRATYLSTACSATPAPVNCAYTVTTAGKANIPNQATYTDAQIESFLGNGWLSVAPGSSLALYSM